MRVPSLSVPAKNDYEDSETWSDEDSEVESGNTNLQRCFGGNDEHEKFHEEFTEMMDMKKKIRAIEQEARLDVKVDDAEEKKEKMKNSNVSRYVGNIKWFFSWILANFVAVLPWICLTLNPLVLFFICYYRAVLYYVDDVLRVVKCVTLFSTTTVILHIGGAVYAHLYFDLELYTVEVMYGSWIFFYVLQWWCMYLYTRTFGSKSEKVMTADERKKLEMLEKKVAAVYGPIKYWPKLSLVDLSTGFLKFDNVEMGLWRKHHPEDEFAILKEMGCGIRRAKDALEERNLFQEIYGEEKFWMLAREFEMKETGNADQLKKSSLSLHERYFKLMLGPFGIQVRKVGKTWGWTMSLCAFIPAMVIGIATYTVLNTVYDFDCLNIDANAGGDLFCDDDGSICCKLVQKNGNYQDVLVTVGGVAITMYGITKLLAIFLLMSDEKASDGAVVAGDMTSVQDKVLAMQQYLDYYVKPAQMDFKHLKDMVVLKNFVDDCKPVLEMMFDHPELLRPEVFIQNDLPLPIQFEDEDEMFGSVLTILIRLWSLLKQSET